MDLKTLFEKVEESDFAFEFSEIIEVFSQPISSEILESVDVMDLVLDVKDYLVTDGDYSKVEAYVKTLETHQPQIMDEVGKYFYQEFVAHFCAIGDFEKAEFYFEPFIENPVNDFDFYILAFKKLMFYQRNTILLHAIKQNYKEVRDSDKLIGYPLRDFDFNIYYLTTQEVYEKSDQNFDIELLQKKLKPYDFDLSEDPVETYSISFYGETPGLQDLITRFNKDQDSMLMLLRNIFMKRMLNKGLQFNISGFLFDTTRNYWDKKSPNKKKGNWKSYFKIKHNSFDSYLIDLKGSFLDENYDQMMALAWGVIYVYDFLSEIEIVDAEQYAESQAVYKRIIAEIIGGMAASLTAHNYVMQWPKPEAVTHQEWDAQQSIFTKSAACKSDRKMDVIQLMKDDFEAFGIYERYILEAFKESVELQDSFLDLMLSMDQGELEFKEGKNNYNEEDIENEVFPKFEDAEILNENYISSDVPYHAEDKPGRNEPCPCGSGKKFKKCCGKNT